MSNEQTDFKEMVQHMTNEMLICTVAAIVVLLDKIMPNAEQAITNLAGILLNELEGTDEQGDQSTTE